MTLIILTEPLCFTCQQISRFQQLIVTFRQPFFRYAASNIAAANVPDFVPAHPGSASDPASDPGPVRCVSPRCRCASMERGEVAEPNEELCGKGLHPAARSSDQRKEILVFDGGPVFRSLGVHREAWHCSK